MRALTGFSALEILGAVLDCRAVVGEGILFGRTLAPAEPLTTLLRSAQSRVFLGRSLAAAYEDTLASPPIEICRCSAAVSNAKIMCARSLSHSGADACVENGARAYFTARERLVAHDLQAAVISHGKSEGVLVAAFQSEHEEETGDLPAEPAVA